MIVTTVTDAMKASPAGEDGHVGPLALVLAGISEIRQAGIVHGIKSRMPQRQVGYTLSDCMSFFLAELGRSCRSAASVLNSGNQHFQAQMLPKPWPR